MASTYSTDLRLELIGSGEQSGVWGSTTNLNLGSLVEQAIAGVEAITVPSADYALISYYGAVDESRNAVLVLSSGAAANVYVPPVNKVYVVKNTGSYAITMYNSTVIGNTTAAGTGVAVSAGTAVLLFTDGTNFSAGGLPSGSTTGTGSVVFSASPTLTGTPLAPTAAGGTNTTQIATTAFVTTAISAQGLGTMSTQNAANVAITGGSITGITDLAVADGGTGSSTLAANAVLLGNGTSALQTVAPGTSGNLLTSNGTTWASTAPTSPITLGTAQASTSGTSIDFTSIPSTVKRITVMFSGVSTDGSSDLLIQLGDSGGVETTGYKSLSTADDVGSNLQSTQSSTSGILIYSRDAAYDRNGSVIFSLLTASTNTWVAEGQLATVQGNPVLVKTAGSKSLSATLDRIRITTANGTDAFDAGSINIMYES